MFETTVTVQRPEGTQVAQHLGVQVDQASIQELMRHRAPYDFRGADAFKIYTLGWFATTLLQQDDVLLDERVTDPNTGAAMKYRVVGRVKNYLYDHQECYAEVVPGA